MARSTERLVAFLLALSGAAVLAAGASAGVSSDVSSNWAGYVASAGYDTATGTSTPFSDVSGTWVQPAASCGSVATTGATASAFWVGLGGNSSASDALEQIGTESDCTSAGAARYWAWYELVPAASVRLGMKVQAGDTISASVHVNGSKVTVKMSDTTRATSFSRILSMSAPDTSSADWIAEAPSLCDSVYSGSCRQAALTNFGTVKFSQASATSQGQTMVGATAGAGHTGTISDPAWSATAVQLIGSDGGFGFRFAPEAASAQATPGALTGGGASFAVKWASVTAASGNGYGNGGGSGYGRGYPYGGGYPGYPSGGGGNPYSS